MPTTPLTEHHQALCAELRPQLAGTLHDDPMTRALYATDASMYAVTPVAVLVPQHTGDVQAALEVAHRMDVPVLPRGGGSSLAGQGVNAALVIDCTKHLNQILELNAAEGWARVQPGLTLDALNEAAAAHGLMVGPDPASSSRATLGGMLANNSTGTHSIRYGNMIDHVRSAEVLLADGTATTFGPTDHAAWQRGLRADGLEGRIYRNLDALRAKHRDVIARDTPAHWRRNNGYRLEALLDDTPNLARLLAGSEGTLAFTTALTVNLVEKPPHTALGVAHFDTRADALRAVTTVLDTDPAAVELFDGVAIERTRQTPGFAERLTFVDGDPGGVLITEYYGATPAELDDRLDALEQTLRASAHRSHVVRLTEPAAIANAWSIRKEGLGLMMGVKGDYKPWAIIEDASVPVEHLADYIDELSAFIDDTGTRAVYYAHASAGCLHVRPFINTKDADDVRKMASIAEASLDLVTKYGGVTSSEHGDGIVRGWTNRAVLGDALYGLCQRTKAIFDPENILNPGRVVDAPRMDQNLRMGPDYRTEPFGSVMDFSEAGGFTAMVEKCNGNGACRKHGQGTMCPSFMATRDEEDSTRGRANALRMALAGRLDDDALTSERMYEVMDLCIQCKACKTECPSNVDMAKLKTEWLGHYWETHDMPLRTKLFAHQPTLARWVSGTPLASLVNWSSRRGLLRQVGERLLGISAARELPPFAPRTFRQWARRQQWTADGPRVVLFADSFNNLHTPPVLKAAAAFLARTGHAVEVPQADTCCGRTYLSKGLTDHAQARALQTVEALYPYAQAGVPIVGLEPSCLLTLRDEFLALLPGEPRAEAVANHAFTFEEYVAQRATEGAFDDIAWRRGATDALMLHGHCHQKALIGTDATERALALPGWSVEAVDAGCCGMAGAFGYEAEHVDISKTMARDRLVPAVERADTATGIAATGFSCRSQIKDTTPRTAQHPAEWLCAALPEP